MSNEHQNTLKKSAAALAVALLLAGCASPKVVESVQVGDAGLGCEQLQKEFDEAERLRAAAESDWGTTGGVMVKTLIFFPATLVSYENVERATKAAEARKSHVAALMTQKNCKIAAKDKDPKKK